MKHLIINNAQLFQRYIDSGYDLTVIEHDALNSFKQACKYSYDKVIAYDDAYGISFGNIDFSIAVCHKEKTFIVIQY